MAAIRGGYLPLAIEGGRLQTPPTPLSCCLCVHCNSGMWRIFYILFFIACMKYNILFSLFKYISNRIPTFFFPYLVRFS